MIKTLSYLKNKEELEKSVIDFVFYENLKSIGQVAYIKELKGIVNIINNNVIIIGYVSKDKVLDYFKEYEDLNIIIILTSLKNVVNMYNILDFNKLINLIDNKKYKISSYNPKNNTLSQFIKNYDRKKDIKNITLKEIAK